MFQPRSESGVAPSPLFWQWDMKDWAGVGGDNVKRDWAAKKSSYHPAKSTTLIPQESGRAGYDFQKNFLLQIDLKTRSQMEASLYCLCSIWPSESPLLWIKIKTAALPSPSALCPALRNAFRLKKKKPKNKYSERRQGPAGIYFSVSVWHKHGWRPDMDWWLTHI